ncbi:MAG: ABC transporter permease [Paracoccaceae bacterium]
MQSSNSSSIAPSPRRFKTARTILALILREMATTYGRSPGGYIWAVLEPAASIAVMSVVFGLALRSPSIGTNFPIFFATGSLPFAFFRETSNKVAGALMYSRALLQYPSVEYTDAILARFLLAVLTRLMVFVVVMSGIHIAYDLPAILDVPAILVSLIMAATLGLGIGCMNCFLFSVFPIWKQLWSVLTAPLFLISAIIYVYENAAAPLRVFLWYNPLVHITGLMRRGFYPTYDAPYVSEVYVFSVSLILIAMGFLLLHRWHRDILNL